MRRIPLSFNRIAVFLTVALGLFSGKCILTAKGASGIFLPADELISINKILCGKVRGEWVPGSQKGGSFCPLRDQVRTLKKQISRRAASPGEQRKLKSKIAALSKRESTQRAVCAGAPNLIAPPPAPTAAAVPLSGALAIEWQTNLSAQAATNPVGWEGLFFCPPNPPESLPGIFGTSVYTSDSSVCTAGVHMGIVGTETGGNVRVRLKEGGSLYIGSFRNGVESFFFDTYGSSYVFIDPSSGAEIISNDPLKTDWATSAYYLRQSIGRRFTFLCPLRGSATAIWGTDTYTYDSSICTAAVHAGLITFTYGGLVTIQMTAGRTSYKGTLRRGVYSQPYGSWDGSFVFVR